MSEMYKVQPGTKVPPGDETGLYYIIIANLPWQCSWQRLKDFARNQQADGLCLNVDHAVVYPGTTNGWVRIKGKEDFHNALAHLDGGVFEHRALMADGRNETSWVHLPDISCARTAPLPRRSRQGSASSTLSTYIQQPSSSFSEYSNQDCYPPAGNFSPATASFPSYVPQTLFESPQYAVQQPLDYRPPVSATGGVTLAGNMAPLTPIYIPPSMYGYMAPISYNEMMQVPVSEPINLQTVDHQPAIKTEARKIIITQLPHSTRQSDLHELLIKIVAKLMVKGKVSKESLPKIQGLEIPAHSDGKPKGHAFAVFDNHHTAKCVVNAIDNYKFQGRLLNARLAKEGVESTMGTSTFSTETRSALSSDQRSSRAPKSTRSSSKMSKRDERRPPPIEPDVASMAGLEICDVRPASSAKEGSGRYRAKVDETPKSSRAMWNVTPAVVDGSSSGQRVGSDRERKHRG